MTCNTNARSRTLELVNPGVAGVSASTAVSRTRRGARAVAVGLAAALTLTAITVAAASAAERLSDKEIERLLDRIDQRRDRFEDALDDTLKRSILREPEREVDVARALDDFEESIDRAKERFTENYSASAEVTTLLRQGTAIERYMALQPPNFKGASEWNELAASLGELAAAYGTRFPMLEGDTARRIGDRELRDAAEQASAGIERFKQALDDSLKKNPAADESVRESVIKEVEALKRDAETLESRLRSGDPASGEARQILERAWRVRLMTARLAGPLSPEAQQAWISVMASLEKIAQGFGIPLLSVVSGVAGFA
jgi:hypothetical protein